MLAYNIFLNIIIILSYTSFYLYPIFNLLIKDYICFKQALEFLKSKQQLSPEGLVKIKRFILEMN